MKAGVILVVDDDDDVRRMIRHTLAPLDYRISEACDGASAIAFVRDVRPLAVVVDFLMPGTDGLAVVQELQQLVPGVPIIFTTGYANEERLRLTIGEDIAILHKPFRMSELLSLLQDVIEGV